VYCDYFGLDREPFSIAPDPAFVYPSAKHRQALAHLKYGLEREGGFLLLTGEVGTGKTTLVRLLVEQIPASFRIAYILNATLDRLDVLASICEELGLEVEAETRSAKTYVDRINADLLQAHAEGRKTLVIIEEAQNLSPEVLEMLRLLTNLETNTTKLLHILLVGQPELLDTIGLPQLRQLDQRIISRFHLEPLDRSETEHYLNHRLAKAGCIRPLFERKAIRRMHQLADGIPRKLNLLAERALLGAFAESKNKVGTAQVMQARREVFGDAVRQKKSAAKSLVVAALFMMVAVAALYFLQSSQLELGNTDAQLVEQRVIPSDEVVSEPEPAEDQVPQAPVIAEPQPEQRTVFSSLLTYWSVDAPAESAGGMCAVAYESGLLCAEQTLGSIQEIMAINRPMLVGQDGESVVLIALEEGQVRLVTPESPLVVDEQTFVRGWDGDVVYLWRPPPGYNGSVWVGDRNSTVISWVLDKLRTINPEQPDLITGGNYSQAVSDAVAAFQRAQGLTADGVLGQKTIMKLNELLASVPVLEGVPD
jgi:general secretion pathway protein A